jgi:PAS domain S-box-containing protein
MKKQCEPGDRECIQNKIAGLGERSFRKSYYPELQKIERFKMLLDQSNDAIFLLGVPDGRFVDVNQSVCEQLGYDCQDVLKMSIYDILCDSSDAIEGILSGNVSSIVLTATLRCRTGRKIPYEINARKVCFGGNTYAVAVARNIEERVLIERTLRESEEKFKVLVEMSSAVIYVYQGENLVFVNDAAERVTGYSKDKLLKMKFWDIVHPDFRELVRERGLARQHGEPVPSPYEIKFITNGGEERWAELTAGRIMFMGKPAGVATFFDITERKLAEKSLIDSQKMLQLVMDNIPQAIFWKDKNSVYLGCNKVLARDAGFKDPGDIIGKTDFDLPTTREQTESYRKYDQIVMITDEPIYHIIEEQRRPDGTTAWLDTNKIPLHDTSGKVIGILCTYEDITERKRAEEALAEAKALAELYVDLMGHDINNMNQVALGYLEMADSVIKAGGEIGEKNRALLDKTIESLNSSSRLIDKVMKLRKLKTIELRLEQMDVCSVLSSMKDRYSHVSGKDITINYVPPGECLVVANELIDEIFINLIENAVKHSHEDKPLVIDILQTEVCEDGKEYFRISIEDNGPGLPDPIKDKLFTRYFKGKASVNGKGLGLFLVKTLVEDFQGTVWVEDRVHGDHTKGAKFVVLLPAVTKSDR